MTMKRVLFEKSLTLHRMIAAKWGKQLEINRLGMLATRRMNYDSISETGFEKWNIYEDYVRYRAFEINVEEIKKRYSNEEIRDFCVAEAGVFLGDFAWMINRSFPECDLYLYDTFSGFNNDDISIEVHDGYTEKEYMSSIHDYFKTNDLNEDDKMKIVKSKMSNPERCVFRKGFFPQTACDESNKKWIFVSLDMDLYQPMLEGILFFYRNLVPGGYIFIHDYNNVEFRGVRKALDDAEKIMGVIPKFALPDQGGSVILQKI